MAVRIVENKCTQINTNAMSIMLEADNRDELTTRDARDFAITSARQMGFPARGISSIPHPYPVDDKGETNDQLIMGRTPIKAWWAEYQVSLGLGM